MFLHEHYWDQRPEYAGEWVYLESFLTPIREARTVLVEENPISGIFCRELKMGGSALCGFQDWAGLWREATDTLTFPWTVSYYQSGSVCVSRGPGTCTPTVHVYLGDAHAHLEGGAYAHKRLVLARQLAGWLNGAKHVPSWATNLQEVFQDSEPGAIKGRLFRTPQGDGFSICGPLQAVMDPPAFEGGEPVFTGRWEDIAEPALSSIQDDLVKHLTRAMT